MWDSADVLAEWRTRFELLALLGFLVLVAAEALAHCLKDRHRTQELLERAVIVIFGIAVILELAAYFAGRRVDTLERPRHLPTKLAFALSEAARAMPGVRLSVAVVNGDPEAEFFADRIAAALGAGGAQVERLRLMDVEATGVMVVARGAQLGPCDFPQETPAAALARAFRGSGYGSAVCKPNTSGTFEQPQILIGRNPQSPTGRIVREGILGVEPKSP
jgi:hypothetical protein